MGSRGGASGKSGGGGAKKFQEVTDDSIFDKSVKDWKYDMTGAERDTLTDYTEMFYSRVNYDLRWDNTEDFEKQISELDSAISKFNLTSDIVTYRGASKSAFGGGVPEIGAIISDKAYLSTSIDKSVAQNFDKGYIFKINVPKGKGRGAYVDSISYHKGEREFLMKRSSKLKITGTASGESEGFYGGQTVIYADLV